MLKIFLIIALSALFLIFPGCTGNDSPSVTDDIQSGVNNAVDETQNMADDLVNGTEDMLSGEDNSNGNPSAKMNGNMTDTNNSAVTGNPSQNNMQ